MTRPRPHVVARALLLAATVAAGISRAGASSAGDAAHAPGDAASLATGGWFLRLAPGATGVSNRVEQGADRLAVTGTGAALEAAIGRVVRPHLALHATLFGWWVAGPHVDLNVTGIASGSDDVAGHAALGALGGGVTRDALPAGLYVSASAGAGRFTLTTDEGGRHRSDPGLALEVVAGREWPVARGWGVGIAGSWLHASLPDHELVRNWTCDAFGVRLSATHRGRPR